MTFFTVSFVLSLIATLIVVHSSTSHLSASADHDFSGPQKFHSRPVPRIGGIGLVVGIAAGIATLQNIRASDAVICWTLLACGLPAFASGLAEDLTKSVSPRRRLIATAVSAGLAAWWLGAVVTRTDIPGIDTVIAWFPAAVALTLLAVTGVVNAINIIDGFNGLASMCAVMMLAAVGYVAFQVGDELLVTLSLVTIGAVLGFFVWNFPAGLIFLGDGGAYFLGFALAELGVLLLHRNEQVSPLFPLLLYAYPIFETLFSIYRKKFLRGMSPGVPDGIHLHMLVYKRLMRWAVGPTHDRRRTARNSMTSPYLWLLCLSSVIPAVLWWDSTPVLTGFLILFMLFYLFLYWSIVRFKTPKWLILRRR